jgi:hypothetical protein
LLRKPLLAFKKFANNPRDWLLLKGGGVDILIDRGAIKGRVAYGGKKSIYAY